MGGESDRKRRYLHRTHHVSGEEQPISQRVPRMIGADTTDSTKSFLQGKPRKSVTFCPGVVLRKEPWNTELF